MFFRLFSSICFGVNPCFIKYILFKLFVAFLITSLLLIFLPSLFWILLLFRRTFLNSLIFCSVAKALPPPTLVLNILTLNFVFSFLISFCWNPWYVCISLILISSFSFFHIRRYKTALIFFSKDVFFHRISINFRGRKVHEEQTVFWVDSGFSKKSNVYHACMQKLTWIFETIRPQMISIFFFFNKWWGEG